MPRSSIRLNKAVDVVEFLLKHLGGLATIANLLTMVRAISVSVRGVDDNLEEIDRYWCDIRQTAYAYSR